MSNNPFKEEDVSDAKSAFADAWLNEIRLNPFKPDPFRAALTIWNEDKGTLNLALWVAHSGKWNEDAEVLEYVEEAKAIAIAEADAEKFKFVRNKELGREFVAERLYARLALENDSDKLVKIANEIAKLEGFHEKPNDDGETGRILGIIQHELKPVDASGVAIPYDDRVRNQQRALQVQVAAFEKELEGGDNARLVN